jgi:hypothetical protein
LSIVAVSGKPVEGNADRLFQVRIPKADVIVDACSSPPGMWASLDTGAVELGDERRRALKTVSGAHHLMVPQRHGACQYCSVS